MDGDRIDKLKASSERMTILCIAYHNIAVEQEFLKQYNPCLRSYKKAAECARDYLGETAPITVNLENVYDQVTKKIANEIERTWRRRNKNKLIGKKTTQDIESLLLNAAI